LDFTLDYLAMFRSWLMLIMGLRKRWQLLWAKGFQNNDWTTSKMF
jgi:hypothetical protein